MILGITPCPLLKVQVERLSVVVNGESAVMLAALALMHRECNYDCFCNCDCDQDADKLTATMFVTMVDCHSSCDRDCDCGRDSVCDCNCDHRRLLLQL